MADPKINFYRTSSGKLGLLEVRDGQLIFVEDTRKIYLDTENGRTEYGQIITLVFESQRVNMAQPIEGVFYFVEETNCFWRYKNGWISLTPQSDGEVIQEVYFLDSLPDVGIANKIYVNGKRLYQWTASGYEELGAPYWDAV